MWILIASETLCDVYPLIFSEDGGGVYVHPAGQKGGAVLSSTTEGSEEHPLRHHEGSSGADSGHSGEGAEDAQAWGEEDEARGGVVQPILQHFLQDGLDKRGEQVQQGLGGHNDETNRVHREGGAGEGGRRVDAKSFVAHAHHVSRMRA